MLSDGDPSLLPATVVGAVVPMDGAMKVSSDNKPLLQSVTKLGSIAKDLDAIASRK